MDDDIYPNDGTYYQPAEPEEQVRARQQSHNKALAAKPMLKDLIDVFDQDIAQLARVDAIHVDPTTQPEEFLKAWYAAQEVVQYAKDKKAFLESLLLDLK